MALLTQMRGKGAGHRSEGARPRLRGRRGLKLEAVALLASLVVLVPSAGAALDPSDAVCTGSGMLASESGGSENTACGFNALNQNTGGVGNTATGDSALFSNTTGAGNTAAGGEALYSNTTGAGN